MDGGVRVDVWAVETRLTRSISVKLMNAVRVDARVRTSTVLTAATTKPTMTPVYIPSMIYSISELMTVSVRFLFTVPEVSSCEHSG